MSSQSNKGRTFPARSISSLYYITCVELICHCSMEVIWSGGLSSGEEPGTDKLLFISPSLPTCPLHQSRFKTLVWWETETNKWLFVSPRPHCTLQCTSLQWLCCLGHVLFRSWEALPCKRSENFLMHSNAYHDLSKTSLKYNLARGPNASTNKHLYIYLKIYTPHIIWLKELSHSLA